MIHIYLFSVSIGLLCLGLILSIKDITNLTDLCYRINCELTDKVLTIENELRKVRLIDPPITNDPTELFELNNRLIDIELAIHELRNKENK